MLNFAEQTGSGAVIVVWSSLIKRVKTNLYKLYNRKYAEHTLFDETQKTNAVYPARGYNKSSVQ
jgi:hypothetical protein